MKQLKSKRNQVFLDEKKNIVIKIFTNHDDYLKEVDIYHQLKNFKSIPMLIDKKDNQIILEYLDHPTLLDELERQEKEGFNIEVWKLLFDKLRICKKHCGSLPTDPNLRNFLYNNQMIYFLDFEQYEAISLKQCYHRIVAYIMLYDPAYSKVKKEIMDNLIHTYDLDPVMIKTEINQIVRRRMK